jgi:hypothetical protein
MTNHAIVERRAGQDLIGIDERFLSQPPGGADRHERRAEARRRMILPHSGVLSAICEA